MTSPAPAPERDVHRFPERMVGRRVIVRRWVPHDVDGLAALVLRNLDHLRPWMPWVAGEPLAREDRLALLQGWDRAWRAGGDLVAGIFLAGAPIGGTGLHRRDVPDAVEIGYWIDRDHVRQGFATEVAALLTASALSQPGIDIVEIHHDKANTVSGRIPPRLGYTLVGEATKRRNAPGQCGIDCTWRVSAAEWGRRGLGGHAGR